MKDSSALVNEQAIREVRAAVAIDAGSSGGLHEDAYVLLSGVGVACVEVAVGAGHWEIHWERRCAVVPSFTRIPVNELEGFAGISGDVKRYAHSAVIGADGMR